MLQHTKESIKGDTASGTVALGLMPTILTFLGFGSAETALLSRRRPVLAFLIAFGAPAVNPLPTFVYENLIAELRARKGQHLAPKQFSTIQAAIVSLLEYGVVLGAVANVITAGYYAGLWTVNTISCDSIYYPVLWAVLTGFIHLFGMLALTLRVETIRDQSWRGSSWRSKLRQWVEHEFTPCVTHGKLALEWKPETYLFIGISWWTSIITVTHLLWGTIAFSSLQFLGKIPEITTVYKEETCSHVFEVHGFCNRLSSCSEIRASRDEECFRGAENKCNGRRHQRRC